MSPRPGAALALVGALLVLSACRSAVVASEDEAGGGPEQAPATPTATAVQVLAFNDFHGRIGLPMGRDGVLDTGRAAPVPAGGAVHLARTLSDLRADFGGDERNSLTLAAGDLVGASPFSSGGYNDEPAVEVLDALGLDFSAVGNHEFDRGADELFRLSGATDGRYRDEVGACEGVDPGEDGCFLDSTGERYQGSGFGYLGANVLDAATGEPALPPYAVVPTSGGTEVGIIGVVTQDVAALVPADALDGLTIEDPVAAVNRSVAELRDRGIEAIVLLAHEGGAQGEGGRFDTCVGELSDTRAGELNAEVDPAVDAIIGGHTHSPYTCSLPGPAGEPRPVTQAAVYGRSVTDLRFTIGADGEVDRTTVAVTAVPVLREEPDRRVAAIVEDWVSRSAEVGNARVGSLAETITRAPDPESGVGVLVADAMLGAARRIDFAVPELALVNQPWLRADLVRNEGRDGAVTYRDLFRVMPFDHTVQVATVSGAAIRSALERGAGGGPGVTLSTSGGVTYTYDPGRSPGDRVDPCSLRVDGRWIDPAGSYRVALTSFLLGGGDGYDEFEGAAGVVEGPPVLEALADHVAATSPVAPPPGGRVVAGPERLSC